MKRLLASIALVIGMGFGALVTPSPAGAHNPSAEGLWSCAYTRNYDFLIIDHSPPVALGSGWVEFWCHGYYNGTQYRYMWRAILFVDTGDVYRSTPYTNCNVTYCREP